MVTIFESFRKRKMRIKNVSLFFISLFFIWSSFAQSANMEATSQELTSIYNRHIGQSAILYSGPAYITLGIPMEGSPFLNNDTLAAGWISYNGQHYDNVLLQWDILQNYVLTQSLVENARIILRNDLIDSFYYAGHLVKFMAQDKENNLMQEGLYDVIYSGPTTLMARREKINKQEVGSNSITYRISEKNIFYIRKKGTYYRVDNRNDLAYVFGNSMTEIKRFVRNNHLKWKDDLEQILLFAVDHYDKVNPLK